MNNDEFTVKFQPIHKKTLALLIAAYEGEGEDPYKTYSRLLSAFLMSAAMIELTADQIHEQATLMLPTATRALNERRDIFGGQDA